MAEENTFIKQGVHPAVILGIIAAVVVFGYLALDTRPSTDSSTATSTSAQTNQTAAPTIPPILLSNIQLSNLQLNCQPYSLGYGGVFPNCNSGEFQITGQGTNNSSTSFVGINITVDAYDCPTTTINSSCSHIGQNTYSELLVSNGYSAPFPPGQTREALALVTLSGLPPIQGNFEWQYTVTGFWNGFEEIPVTQ